MGGDKPVLKISGQSAARRGGEAKKLTRGLIPGKTHLGKEVFLGSDYWVGERVGKRQVPLGEVGPEKMPFGPQISR